MSVDDVDHHKICIMVIYAYFLMFGEKNVLVLYAFLTNFTMVSIVNAEYKVHKVLRFFFDTFE